MAGEIIVHNPALEGETLYATLKDFNGGLIRDVSTPEWEDFDPGNWADFVIDVPEDAEGGGYFVGDMPASIAEGLYRLDVHLQQTAGEGNEASTDPVIESIVGQWSGSAWATVSDFQGAGADPLATVVPGAYASNTFGGRVGMLLTNRVRMVSPVTATGDIEIIGSADYNAGITRALSWDDDGTWIDLTGYSATFVGENRAGEQVVLDADILDPGGSQSIRLELTNAESLDAATKAITAFAVWVEKDDDNFPLLYGGVTPRLIPVPPAA